MIIYFSLCVYAMWAYVYFFCWAYARECVCINKMCVSLLVQVTVWSTQLIINYGHIFTKKRKKGKKREKNKKESSDPNFQSILRPEIERELVYRALYIQLGIIIRRGR